MGDSSAVSKGDLLDVIRGELDRSPQLASGHSRRTYLSALSAFERWRDGRALSKALVQTYIDHLLEQGRAPATVNHDLVAIRWWARRLADLAAEDTSLPSDTRNAIVERITGASTVLSVKGEGAQRGRHVTDDELRALLGVCVADDSPAGVRDAAAIAVGFSTGMLRSELVGLQTGDVAPIEGGYELTVRHAKADKTRRVAVLDGAGHYLRDWLAVRGDRPGALFLAVRQNGAIVGQGLSDHALQLMLIRRAQVARVASISWHDARRTLADNLLGAGVDLSTVQRILGHSSPVTTAAYDRRPDEARKAPTGLPMPYLKL
jgi:integrase